MQVKLKKKRLLSRHPSFKLPQRPTFSRFIHHFVHQFSFSASDRPSGSRTLLLLQTRTIAAPVCAVFLEL